MDRLNAVIHLACASQMLPLHAGRFVTFLGGIRFVDLANRAQAVIVRNLLQFASNPRLEFVTNAEVIPVRGREKLL
ncbi:MAG: hypothetical protein U0798_03305 [Gemmataceae bacterium]